MKYAVIYDGQVLASINLPEGVKSIPVVHKLGNGALMRVDDHRVSTDPNDTGAADETGSEVVTHVVDGLTCYEIKRPSLSEMFKNHPIFGK